MGERRKKDFIRRLFFLFCILVFYHISPPNSGCILYLFSCIHAQFWLKYVFIFMYPHPILDVFCAFCICLHVSPTNSGYILCILYLFSCIPNQIWFYFVYFLCVFRYPHLILVVFCVFCICFHVFPPTSSCKLCILYLFSCICFHVSPPNSGCIDRGLEGGGAR